MDYKKRYPIGKTIPTLGNKGASQTCKVVGYWEGVGCQGVTIMFDDDLVDNPIEMEVSVELNGSIILQRRKYGDDDE